MKLQLLDAEDLKAIEDTMMRALVRALRVAKREGLIPGYEPPAPEHVEREPAPALPSFGQHLVGGNAAAVEDDSSASERKPRRRYNEVLETVATRPPGFITTDDAYPLIGETESDKAALRKWIFDKQVRALIVLDAKYGPPTKGCPGRVMVDKQSVVARQLVRSNNATLPPVQRTVNGAVSH